MNIQEILDQRFGSYEKAIAVYGSDRILIAFSPQPTVRPLPCSLEEDMVSPRVPEIPVTKIKLELVQFSDGWRYISMGEV